MARGAVGALSVWSTRRARALALANDKAHAADILRCYADVTEVQERIATRVPVGEWATAAAGAAGESGKGGDRGRWPALRLTNLPSEALQDLFEDFLARMTTVGTEVMTAEATALAAGDAPRRRAALESALAPSPAGADGATFHARAFLEAVATTLAARVLPTVGADDTAATACRVCGARPVVATLRDLPGALGSRALVCSRCGVEWRVRRLTCTSCGETESDRLRIHTAEGLPHVRIDECETCRHYIKTVDLRRRGDAVPVVDEIASVELDLWAGEQGLTKAAPNLFAL